MESRRHISVLAAALSHAQGEDSLCPFSPKQVVSFENRLAQRAECMPYAAYADIRVSIRLRKSS